MMSQIKIEWAPFDAGAFFEMAKDAIAWVTLTRLETSTVSLCKTSITTGLFWRE